MKRESARPKIRRKPDFISFLEEMKFLKSFSDCRYFLQKIQYLLPRLTGRVDRWTKVPPAIQIEPTFHCNLDCTTCCRSKSRRQAGYMNFPLFMKIIDDARNIGVKRVLLFLFGESLLHPEIVEMIRYIKQKGLGFHLTTNGVLLDDAMGRAILQAGVTSADYVTFSILGFSEKVHEMIMRGASHATVVENVMKFVENRKKLGINGPVIEAVFYAIPENEHELEPFLDYWGRIVDHAIDGGRAVEAFIDQGLPVAPRVRTCSELWERMAVHWNGDVAMCGEDVNGDWIVGNLRDQTIQEVWLGEKLTLIKKNHKEGRFDKISMCEFCDW
jgi:radical SAM protein with 4Fe4S-binding SPASM domain